MTRPGAPSGPMEVRRGSVPVRRSSRRVVTVSRGADSMTPVQSFLGLREAMGPRWGSLAAWFYWINNAYWIPSVYLVFAESTPAITSS